MDLIQEINKIPPVTRTFCGLLVSISLPIFAKAVSPYKFSFIGHAVWKQLQIWRPFTCFFIGNSGFAFVFELATLYQMTNQLETGPYHLKTADFIWQSLIAGTGLIAATRPLIQAPSLMIRAMLGCLVYLSSSLSPPGAQTSVMGLFTIPIKYYPYIMIAMDLVMAGTVVAMYSVAGCVVGHLWWWAVWGGSLGSQGRFAVAARAPRWLRNLFGEGNRPRPTTGGPQGGAAAGLREAGIEVVAPRRRTETTTGYNWGSGRRLGTN